RRNRANHGRPFAKSESRGQGGARFCAGFRSHSDSRRFYGRFVKARRGKGEGSAACSQDIGRAGKEIGFYCLVAERTHLSTHSRLTNGSASMTLLPVFFLIAWPTQNPLPNARARPSAEHFAIAAF